MKSATDNAEELIINLARDEPGSPGRDHHRDHGDRQRSRALKADKGSKTHSRCCQIISSPSTSIARQDQLIDRRLTPMTTTDQPIEGRAGRHCRSVLDAEFPHDHLPEINTAVE
jgi:hypothetical protein